MLNFKVNVLLLNTWINSLYMEHIVIIGNGAGVTLARHIRKNQIQKLLLYLFWVFFSANVRVYGAHEVWAHTILWK
jgi:hypothetical protein